MLVLLLNACYRCRIALLSMAALTPIPCVVYVTSWEPAWRASLKLRQWLNPRETASLHSCVKSPRCFPSWRTSPQSCPVWLLEIPSQWSSGLSAYHIIAAFFVDIKLFCISRNDNLVPEGKRVTITEDSQGRSILSFDPALPNDAGIYKVVARNRVR
jgi:hypothetical protein